MRAAIAAVQDGGGHPLNWGQRLLVEHFTRAGTQIAAAVGPAGTGKTTAMRAAAAAWQLDGHRVIALGPSARAAEELAAAIGTPGQTIDRLLTVHEVGAGGPADRVHAGDMLLVDEAGMAGTRKLDRLVTLAAERGAVVRLIGDPEQLAAVEAGGLLRLLAAETPAAMLTDVHRFTDPGEADASLAVRAGDATAVDWYLAHDRVHAGTRDALVEQLYRDWRADSQSGRAAVMLAGDNATVTELNDRARLDRVIAGDVAAGGVPAAGGVTVGAGDVIVTRNNRADLLSVGARNEFVRNGDLWTVQQTSDDGSLHVQSATHGGSVTLPADYVAEYVQLGYAATIHRAQGITAEVGRVLVDESMSRQQLYTAATRGGQANELYVPTDHTLDVSMAHSPTQGTDPRAALTAIVNRDAGERSALQTAVHELDAPRRVDTIVAGMRYAGEVLTGPGLPGRTDTLLREVLREDLADRAIDDPALGALAAEVAALTLRGDDPEQALRDVIDPHDTPDEPVGDGTGRRPPLDQTQSIPQILAWRIHADQPPTTDGPLPWIPPVTIRTELTDEQHQVLDWITHQQDLLGAQVEELGSQLGDTPVDQREPWAQHLGQRPEQAAPAADWTRAAGVLAAYREQYAITSTDNPLGPAQSAPLCQPCLRHLQRY